MNVPGAAVAATSCKVCGAAAPRWGTCDLNAHCGRFNVPGLLPPAGVEVTYHRCAECGFLFTRHMDGFSRDEFSRLIYNADYRLVDPEFEQERPADLADRLVRRFGNLPIHLCDYGGGSGRLAELVNAAGGRLRATSWDPFFSDGPKPTRRFDMVVSFEVFEHTPTPAETLADMLSLASDDRVVLVGTLCQPEQIHAAGMNWWYCAPRNGHISLHTRKSLQHLADEAGVGVIHLEDGAHLFHDMLPDWLQHSLLGPQSMPWTPRHPPDI